MEKRLNTSPIVILLYPLICCGIGAYIVSRLGGFPPPAWRDLIQSLPQFPAMMQQGQGVEVSILIAQSLSWFIAWSSLLLMGSIATYRALEKLFTAIRYPRGIVGAVDTLGTATSAHIASSVAWHYHQNKQYANPVQIGNVANAPTMMFPEVEASPIHTQEAQEATIEISTISPIQPPIQSPLHSVGADIDMRSLKQMGFTPYSVSTRPAKRKLNAIQLQQSRLQRRIRLAHVESPRATEPLARNDGPTNIEEQAVYNDAGGNAYLYWNDFSQSNDILTFYAATHLKDSEEVQEGN
jgi:hypothetical protein